MPTEQVNLNEIARRLLADGTVDVVIGYTTGSQPLVAVPAFVRDPQDADTLVFNRFCEQNLVNYLHRFKAKRVAVVVKGCDERSVIGLIQEKQLDRQKLVLIGAPCAGIVDPRLVPEDATEEETLGDDVMYAGCAACAVRNPRFADYLIGAPVPQPEAPEFSDTTAELEDVESDERWRYFSREMRKCILCFACRNVCPACYCNVCFTESSQPKWMSKTDDESDAMFFHLTRLLHLTGRCTGCGACARACPVNVDLRTYNDRLRKDVKDVFEFEAGLDPEARAPMTCFRDNDKNEFIK